MGVAGGGAALLAALRRALQAELTAVERARARVDAARATMAAPL